MEESSLSTVSQVSHANSPSHWHRSRGDVNYCYYLLLFNMRTPAGLLPYFLHFVFFLRFRRHSLFNIFIQTRNCTFYSLELINAKISYFRKMATKMNLSVNSQMCFFWRIKGEEIFQTLNGIKIRILVANIVWYLFYFLTFGHFRYVDIWDIYLKTYV